MTATLPHARLWLSKCQVIWRAETTHGANPLQCRGLPARHPPSRVSSWGGTRVAGPEPSAHTCSTPRRRVAQICVLKSS